MTSPDDEHAHSPSHKDQTLTRANCNCYELNGGLGPHDADCPIWDDLKDAHGNAEIEQQNDTADAIFEEDMDRRLAERDIADRSLMDAAAAIRHRAPGSGLYELHARLDGGHLAAARQVIADARPGVELEAGS